MPTPPEHDRQEQIPGEPEMPQAALDRQTPQLQASTRGSVQETLTGDVLKARMCAEGYLRNGDAMNALRMYLLSGSDFPREELLNLINEQFLCNRLTVKQVVEAYRYLSLELPMDLFVRRIESQSSLKERRQLLFEYEQAGVRIPREHVDRLADEYVATQRMTDAFFFYQYAHVTPSIERLIELGNSFLQDRNYWFALREFRAAEAKGRLLELGERCMQEGEMLAAIEAFEAADAKEQFRSCAIQFLNHRCQRVEALYQLDEAIEIYERAVGPLPTTFFSDWGERFLAQHKVLLAREAFERAGVDAREKLRRMCEEIGTVNAYRDAALEVPREVRLEDARQLLHSRKRDFLDDINRGLRIYREYQAEPPREDLIALAEYLLQSGYLTRAADFYKRANIELPRGHYNRWGDSLIANNNLEAAVEAYTFAANAEGITRCGDKYLQFGKESNAVRAYQLAAECAARIKHDG